MADGRRLRFGPLTGCKLIPAVAAAVQRSRPIRDRKCCGCDRDMKCCTSRSADQPGLHCPFDWQFETASNSQKLYGRTGTISANYSKAHPLKHEHRSFTIYHEAPEDAKWPEYFPSIQQTVSNKKICFHRRSTLSNNSTIQLVQLHTPLPEN